MTFPAYAMTVEKDTFIILRTAPDAPNPTSGAIPTISRPTPLEISAQATGENGQLWYLVRNMSNGDTGYVESYNVRPRFSAGSGGCRSDAAADYPAD